MDLGTTHILLQRALSLSVRASERACEIVLCLNLWKLTFVRGVVHVLASYTTLANGSRMRCSQLKGMPDPPE